MPDLNPLTIARQELENFWRRKVLEAYERYQTATMRYSRLLQEEPEGQIRSQDGAVARAQREEAETLSEYAQLLKIFTELTVDRRMPQGPPGPSAEWEPVTKTLISVVDDDESIRDSTKILLRSAGYRVATFESGESFLKSDTLSKTECLVVDILMPGMGGLELQRQLSISEAGVPIIFVTAHADKRNRQLAIDGGASDFFQKPFAASEFLAAIQTALKKCA